MVGGASLAGIALVLLVAILGDNSLLRATLIVIGFGSPFLLALLSLVAPLSRNAQRWVWLVCGLGATVPAFFFLWNGTGFLLFLIAGIYLWAFARSRSHISMGSGAAPSAQSNST